MDPALVLLAVFILVAFYTDIRSSLIPNWLSVAGAVTGMLWHTLANGWSGFLYAAFGLLCGFGILLLLYLLKAVGAGDVKLFAAIGSLAGVELTLNTIMYSVVYAGVIGVVLILFRKEFSQRIGHIFKSLFNLAAHRDIKMAKQLDRKENFRFPFMYAVLPAIITAFYYMS